MTGMPRDAISGRGDLAMLFTAGAVGRLDDAELLERFVQGGGNPASEAAFRVLLNRHGPMVLGVCRRVLGDEHAAADAFQATFLVLARKARSVRVDDSLGRWLYGVSVRVARRARVHRQAERRRARSLDDVEPAALDPTHPCERDDLRAAIDEEVARLPARYRAAVVLCVFEGLSQEQAARRLRCPVGTVESRLFRARQRLRAGLTRRGVAPAVVSGLAVLAATTAQAEVAVRLSAATAAAAARLASGAQWLQAAPAAVAALAVGTLRRTLLMKVLGSGLVLAVVGLSLVGAGVLAGGDGKAEGEAKAASSSAGAPRQDPEPPGTVPGGLMQPMPKVPSKLARDFAEIRTRYEDLAKKTAGPIPAGMPPDGAFFAREVLDLVESSPPETAARDALFWALVRLGEYHQGESRDDYGRAVNLLVRDHAADPEVARFGLQLDNVLSIHRDQLLERAYVSAKGHEGEGLARLALAQYLVQKARYAEGLRNSKKPPSSGIMKHENGKMITVPVETSPGTRAYWLHLRLSDPEAMRAEAKRLFEEVVKDYADVPYETLRGREWAAEITETLKQPKPSYHGEPLTPQQLDQARRLLARKQTLADVARARLDEMENLVVGKPAPAIAGVGVDGKPMRLSDHRGKVVVLVFWGTWCGPCLAEVPHERALAEKFQGKPFALLGVDCEDDLARAREVMAQERITWPSWNDGDMPQGPIASAYHVRSFPTTFVIDRDGKLRHIGLRGDALERAVARLLEEPAKPGSAR